MDRPVTRNLCGGDGVFPVHTGMDRDGTTAHEQGSGFPRAHGDGPAAVWAQHGAGLKFSPCTRGWTVLRQNAPDWHDRFPRAHGDGPRYADVRDVAAYVFPVHTGMDRSSQLARQRQARFPRAHGDGPHQIGLVWNEVSRFPRAHGDGPGVVTLYWSPKKGFPRAHGDGPDRCHKWTLQAGRFPRAHGDGPRPRKRIGLGCWFSPCTRGWTGNRSAGCARAKRFPRAHGDGPTVMPIPFNPPSVFSVHTGMDRSQGCARACSSAFSPCTRGWTDDDVDSPHRRAGFPRAHGDGPAYSLAPGDTCRVFPVHTGMDRSAGASRSPTCSFSPCTRGWTARPGVGGSGRAAPDEVGEVAQACLRH